MKRLIMILTLSFMFIGCGAIQRDISGLTGNLQYKCSKHGVEYVQTENELFVSLLPDGKIATCKP